MERVQRVPSRGFEVQPGARCGAKTRMATALIKCEHVFVTSQGTAYSQFKRALERRHFMLAWTTAAELPKVPLRTGWNCCCSPAILSRRGSIAPSLAGMPDSAANSDCRAA